LRAGCNPNDADCKLTVELTKEGKEEEAFNAQDAPRAITNKSVASKCSASCTTFFLGSVVSASLPKLLPMRERPS